MPECDLGGNQHREPAIARYRHNNLRGGQVTKEGTLRNICSSHFANEIKYWAEHVVYEPLFGQWQAVDDLIKETETYLGRKVAAKEVVFGAEDTNSAPAGEVPPQDAETVEEAPLLGDASPTGHLGGLLEDGGPSPSADELPALTADSDVHSSPPAHEDLP